MRNLKRALSLGLTAAMISGLMVMGSSAASYADVTSENNVEAIDVLQTVGIMVGDENGNFNPDQNVTRNEMAVIMSNLMEYNVATYKDTSPFTDVPSWAEPYVAACWTNGITSGYSDTIYGGSDTVTTAQAALMLMKALGYFQYASDFGSDWQLATTRQANAIDLFVGVDSGVTAPMTRNDVAQLVLNTLEAGTVEASTDGSWTIGDVTINNNVRYSYITSNQPYAVAINDDRSTDSTTDAGRSIVELGEKLYMGDLKLNDDATDVFGRPARYWEYDGDEIGTYAKTELLRQEYTTEVTGRDLYDLLGKSIIDDYSFDIYVDGEYEENILGDAYFTENQLNRSNKDTVGDTGNGVLTQVYQDIDKHEITIAVINTYLAQAQEDYDEKNEEVDLTIYELDNKGSTRTPVYVKTDDNTEDYTVEADEFDIADVVEDDLFLVTVADGAIQSMVAPEILADTTIKNFKLGSYVTADGTQYDYADSVMYDPDVLDQYDDSNMKDLTYNIILDQYGYLIGIEQNEDPDQYLFLTGIDLGSSNLSKKNADANVIFLDGTMDTVTVDMRDSLMTDEAGDGSVKTADLADLTVNIKGTSHKTRAQLNTWCTYTVDSNGVYTLEQVSPKTVGKIDVAQSATNAYDGDENTFTIDQKNISLDGYNGSRVYGNDDTVYLVVDPDDDMDSIIDRDGNPVRIIDDLTSATVGVKNVKLTVKDLRMVDRTYSVPDNEVYTLWNDDGYVIAAVVLGEDDGVTTNYAYITSSNVNREADNDGDDWTWTREAVVNGEIVELTEVGTSLRELGNGASNGNMQQGEWYEIKYDADGNVRSAEWIDVDDEIGDKYATSVYELNQKVGTTNKNLMETYDTVVLGDDGTTYGHTITKLTFKNGSLYVDTAATEGFSVSPDVKVVLALGGSMKKDGTWPRFDDVSDSYSGYAGLEKAIRDMNSQGTFAAGIVEVNAVIERGVATSIIINDTAPSDIANSAAVPNVSVADASVAEGKSVTLTATVTAPAGREFGTLSYQWYKDADHDGVAESSEIIAGATDKTYTIENAVKADADQYICVVTNYDDGKDITGSRENKGQDTATLTVTDAEMTIRAYYRLTNDTIIFSEILTGETDVDGDGYVTVNANESAVGALGYKVVGAKTDYVEFKADGTGSVYFTVQSKSTADVTFQKGSGSANITSTTVNDVMEGVPFTVQLDGNWGAENCYASFTGTDGAKFNITDGEYTASGATLTVVATEPVSGTLTVDVNYNSGT